MDKPEGLIPMDDDLMSQMRSKLAPEVLTLVHDRTKEMGGNPAYAVMLLPDVISLVLCACIENRAHDAALTVLYRLTQKRLLEMSAAQEILEAMYRLDKIIDKDANLN